MFLTCESDELQAASMFVWRLGQRQTDEANAILQLKVVERIERRIAEILMITFLPGSDNFPTVPVESASTTEFRKPPCITWPA